MGELKPGAPVAVGYEAAPAGGGGPGVLLLHAWWGLNDFFRGLCDRLAAEGFVVVAPDLWGGAVATTIEEAEGLISHEQRNSAAMAQAVDGALEHLLSHPARRGEGVGAIGFSMGAAWALDLAGRRPELRAVTIFYGAGEGDFAAARAAFLGHFAADDPWEPLEGVRQMEAEMRAAGREVTLHLYPGAGHWFCEDDRPDAYRPEAAALAWERTLAFLREKLA
jgi:carboxymethylenebutenolidase